MLTAFALALVAQMAALAFAALVQRTLAGNVGGGPSTPRWLAFGMLGVIGVGYSLALVLPPVMAAVVLYLWWNRGFSALDGGSFAAMVAGTVLPWAALYGKATKDLRTARLSAGRKGVSGADVGQLIGRVYALMGTLAVIAAAVATWAAGGSASTSEPRGWATLLILLLVLFAGLRIRLAVMWGRHRRR